MERKIRTRQSSFRSQRKSGPVDRRHKGQVCGG